MEPQLGLFDGATFDADLDGARLARQLSAVRALMADGRWRTLRAISASLFGAPEASVSARLRDLRKPRHGCMDVQRRRCSELSGVWEYRVAPKQEVES